jgi:hypothetical protein
VDGGSHHGNLLPVFSAGEAHDIVVTLGG